MAASPDHGPPGFPACGPPAPARIHREVFFCSSPPKRENQHGRSDEGRAGLPGGAAAAVVGAVRLVVVPAFGGELPGINVPRLTADSRASWYGLPLTYAPEELGGLPIERFHAALQAEGCEEADRPGSTRPLNLLPLFRSPGPLFPEYCGKVRYRPGDFPIAERLHRNTIKLPVWHREEDFPLADAYIDAFTKVIDNHRDLME